MKANQEWNQEQDHHFAILAGFLSGGAMPLLGSGSPYAKGIGVQVAKEPCSYTTGFEKIQIPSNNVIHNICIGNHIRLVQFSHF